jgi:hypothetical protein
VNVEAVDVVMESAVMKALDVGGQPCRIIVGVPAYQALAARDGMAPRSIGKNAATSVRALILGFDMPVDCDRGVEADNAICTYVDQAWGRA